MIGKLCASLAAAILAGFIVSACTPAFGGVMGISSTVTTFTTPDAALTGQGWRGIVLSVMTDDNSVISAVDVNITGALHQRWNFNVDTETFDPTPSSANITNGDSHLNPISGALVGSALTEDNSGAGSPLPDTATRDYGVGTFLKGAWGIPGPSQTNKANLAYIVVRDTDLPNIQIRAQVATSTGTFALDFGTSPPPLSVLSSNPVPGPGIEIDFGYLHADQDPAAIPITLSNTVPGSLTITINSITLTGPSAANYVLTGALPTTLIGGAAPQTFAVDYGVPIAGFGSYPAQVRVETSAGNLIYDVYAVLLPEPSALVVAGLGLLGLAGFARRR